jgi:hypothetical protein
MVHHLQVFVNLIWRIIPVTGNMLTLAPDTPYAGNMRREIRMYKPFDKTIRRRE